MKINLPVVIQPLFYIAVNFFFIKFLKKRLSDKIISESPAQAAMFTGIIHLASQLYFFFLSLSYLDLANPVRGSKAFPFKKKFCPQSHPHSGNTPWRPNFSAKVTSVNFGHFVLSQITNVVDFVVYVLNVQGRVKHKK